MTKILLALVTTVLIDNVVLSQFMGLCPFLGVSKQIKTALGMGAAVIFVITVASAATAGLYRGILLPFNITFLNTIVFIVVIAALVQFVEMILKKFSPALY
ncbi:MAG: electron transport complex subunit RsxA, partial [Clostridia bacterium]|nr:electron transport complex subunit RsxA [Clostridia bacterium]